jgi:hypothetical protein
MVQYLLISSASQQVTMNMQGSQKGGLRFEIVKELKRGDNFLPYLGPPIFENFEIEQIHHMQDDYGNNLRSDDFG